MSRASTLSDVSTPSPSSAPTGGKPWEVEGLALTGREEKLANFLWSRNKTDQLERLMARSRAGLSPTTTSPSTTQSGPSAGKFPPLVQRAGSAGRGRRSAERPRPGAGGEENAHVNVPRSTPAKGDHVTLRRRGGGGSRFRRSSDDDAGGKRPSTSPSNAASGVVVVARGFSSSPRARTADASSPAGGPPVANLTTRRRRPTAARVEVPSPDGDDDAPDGDTNAPAASTSPRAPTPSLAAGRVVVSGSLATVSGTTAVLDSTTVVDAAALDLGASSSDSDTEDDAVSSDDESSSAAVPPDAACASKDDAACERAVGAWLGRDVEESNDNTAAKWRREYRAAAFAAEAALQRKGEVEARLEAVSREYAAYKDQSQAVANQLAGQLKDGLMTAIRRAQAAERELAAYKARYGDGLVAESSTPEKSPAPAAAPAPPAPAPAPPAKDDGEVAPAERVDDAGPMAATPRPGAPKSKSKLTVHMPLAPADAPAFSTPSRPLRRNSLRACRSAKKPAP